MVQHIRSYDMMLISTDSITESSGGALKESELGKKYMEIVCDLIDIFMDENGANVFDVDFDDKSLNIAISVSCLCFEFIGVNNTFMEIAKRALGVSFAFKDEDYVLVTFVFSGIWERSNNE